MRVLEATLDRLELDGEALALESSPKSLSCVRTRSSAATKRTHLARAMN
jgi:hypothetical protein